MTRAHTCDPMTQARALHCASRYAARVNVTVSVRGGVTDRLDIGGRIGQNLWDLHMKYQFSDPEGTGPVISFAPAISVYPWLATAGDAGAGGLLGMVNLPVLIGIPVGEHQFVVGPRLVDYFVTAGENLGGSSGMVNIVFAGSSFAFAVLLLYEKITNPRINIHIAAAAIKIGFLLSTSLRARIS